MLINRIFHRRPIKKPSTQGRRPSTGLCLELQSLENRIPLASGLAAAIEAPVMVRAVEISIYNPGLPLRPELGFVEDSVIDQATLIATPVTGATTLLPSVLPDSAQVPLTNVTDFLSDATNAGAVSAAGATAGSIGILEPASIQIEPPLDAARQLSGLHQFDPTITMDSASVANRICSPRSDGTSPGASRLSGEHQ
jgi:hypothetical protein